MKNTLHKKFLLKTIIFLFVLFIIDSTIFPNNSFGQVFTNCPKQSRLWCVPSKAQVQFPALTAIPLPVSHYQNQQAQFATNCMHDPDGNMLFFIVDGTVYDHQGFKIGDIWKNSNGTIVTGTTEWVIIPVPGQCQQYYLVGGNYESAGTVPYYITLDLNLPNQNPSGDNNSAHGDFIGANNSAYNNIAIPLFFNNSNYDPHSSCLQFAVTPLRPNNDRFLFMEIGDGFIVRFHVTSSGIALDSGSPYFQASYAVIPNQRRSEMEVIPYTDNFNNTYYRLAFPYAEEIFTPPVSIVDYSTVDVINIDFTTGNFLTGSENPIRLANYQMQVHGLEFSKDARYLYVSHTDPNNQTFLEFTDLTTGNGFQNLATINPANLVISNPSDFQYSQIELGYDGHLYFGSSHGMARLDDPLHPILSTWTPESSLPQLPAIPLSTANLGSLFQNDFKNILLLNDQIDGECYQVFNSASCCLANTAFTADNYIANINNPPPFNSTTQTWTATNNPFGNVATVTVRNNLTIPAGFTITIQGMTFKFAPRTAGTAGGGVIIQRGNTTSPIGGKLILNQTTFTSYDDCGNGMWEGVEVQGLNSAPQNNSQGKLVMNNSTIENAYIGAYAAAMTNSSLLFKTGGIIQASNSIFQDNQIGVAFYRYTAAASVSSFTQCQFLTPERIIS